ncbi:MAG: MFS transporter [bacterium]|nr:MFS transporter [Deltaproteobacteria bacterium]MCP4907159.1 MFS transporter [bacterium]
MKGHSTSRPGLLFFVSALALATAGLSFSLRLSLIGALQREHLIALDAGQAGELAGALLGIAFLGFGLTLFLASSLLAVIGMGRALGLCGACFALGSGLVATGDRWLEGDALYRLYWLGFGLCGLGWGFMEAAVNPLTAAAYPDDKTNRLNVVHAWWPAGIIAGGLAALGLEALGFSWEAQFALMLPPALAVMVLAAALRFPKTEREAAGIPMAEMFREILRQPTFLVWWACMLLTAAAELAPGQWIDLALSRTVGMRGILLLVYVSLMMFVLRHFAGPIARRLSPLGMLWLSTALAGLGLVALSHADSPITGIAAATIWGLGVCFLWPTMLANVADRYPRGGEFFLGLMGVAGALSIAFVLPALGRVFDRAKIEIAGSDGAFAQLSGESLERVLAQASSRSFETLAIAPMILFVVFATIWVFERRAIASEDTR